MLYVIAGRPGVGKSAYLNKMKTVYGNSMCILAASDYSSHSALLQELSIRIQNERLDVIAVDEYEESLITQWMDKVRHSEYKTNLQKLSAFAERWNVDVYIVVGLKRKADQKGAVPFSACHLRSKSLLTVTDGLFYMR